MDNLNDNNNIVEEKTIENTTPESDKEMFDDEPLEGASFFGGGDKTYVKKSDKYEDVRSSSFTLLIVGMLGIIFIILSLTKVINIPFNVTTAWLFYSIMSIVFLAFVIGGIISLGKTKKLKEEAEIEDKLIDDINAWAKENITTTSIDSGLDLNETVEILYFSRAEKIKYKLMHKFEDADEGLIDLLTENIYQKLYEEDDATFDEEYEYEEESKDTDN